MSKILELNQITKKFGGLVANENVSFDVEEGEIVGVVGPNGAGKTTLFNSISGAFLPTSGSITFIGRTFQIPQSLNDMTVEDNVVVGALCHTNSMSEAANKVEEVLKLCGMEKYRDMLAGKLNVAQKKRLEIARAMATDPKLLLLDETMAGLTATERVEAVELIRKINKMGIAILTIEHNMDVVMRVSNRVVVLVSGRLLMVGSPEEVTSNPEVISAYLGGGSKDESE